MHSQLLSDSEIMDFFREKNIDAEWSFSDCKPSYTGKWTHNYHRYPAKFIPQLVEKLFDEYIKNNNAHINDPFYGSGTTIVTAISRGFRASGTDINKMAYLITKVKSIPIEPTYLSNKIDRFLARINCILNDQTTLDNNDDVEPFIPEVHIKRIDYWFDNKTKNELGKILRVITQEDDERIRDFLLVAFSHILKNCSFWLQRSTKPTRNLKKTPASPYISLRRHLKKMVLGNKTFYKIVPQTVRNNIDDYLTIKVGDARNQPITDESVDLIVTSSPYVTSYEYADLHQLSTIWLNLVDNLAEYKKDFIGTSFKRYTDRPLRSAIAKRIVDKMLKIKPKLAKEIEAFFIDMEEVFVENFRVLKPEARCCYVIGNTKLKGVDILNAEVFAEGLQHAGFKLDRVIKREIPLKILPQKRDEKTGRFARNDNANSEAYPIEYIVIGLKE